MSSTLRSIVEPTSTRRQFAVHAYRGFGENQDYFFTVNGSTLDRVENDLRNVHWVVARDMGTQRVIDTIDPEIIQLWEEENAWTNIRVIRPGIARKFQCISMVRGNISVAYNDGPAWNAEAYLSYDYETETPIYNTDTNTVNDMLVIGRDSTVNTDDYYQSLPFGTFWAMNDPLVIEYVFSDITYRRAIKNRIDETTLF
jgi:hypothetical protein